MVVGEGFVNHQEHDAGEESQGQADEDGDLEENRTESHQPQLPALVHTRSRESEPAGSLACQREWGYRGPKNGPVSALS